MKKPEPADVHHIAATLTAALVSHPDHGTWFEPDEIVSIWREFCVSIINQTQEDS